jgi:hypothetical protein
MLSFVPRDGRSPMTLAVENRFASRVSGGDVHDLTLIFGRLLAPAAEFAPIGRHLSSPVSCHVL